MRRITRVLVVVALMAASLLVIGGSGSAAPAYPVVEETEHLSASKARRVMTGETLEGPIPFTMVGFSFEGEPAELMIRSRGEDGWSGWTDLDVDSDDGPAPGEPGYDEDRLFSPPLWTGPASRIQVRLADADPAEVEGVQIHFLDSSGRSLSWGQRLAAQLKSSSRPQEAVAAPMPFIVRRHQWGANESIRQTDSWCTNHRYGNVKGAFVHHTATSNDYTRSETAAIVRSIYHYHVKVRDFCDIGYNFLVDRFGTILEGAWGGMDRSVRAAHASEYNKESTGISVIGNFVNVDPPPIVIDSLIRLLDWKLSVHKVLPDSWVKYWTGKVLPTIAGHRDVKSTACPGRIYNYLPQIRKQVRIDIVHPDGALIRGDGTTVFVVDDGAKRAIRSPAILESQFRWKEIIRVTQGSIHRYPSGPAMGFREGTLIRTPDKTVYIVSNRLLRGFVSAHVFDQLGYSWDNIIDVPWKVAEAHAKGLPVVSELLPHPDGTLLKAAGPSVYYMYDGRKRPFTSAKVFESQFRWREIVWVSQPELDRHPTGAALGFREGMLLGTPDGTVWVISDGRRHPFSSAALFEGMNYSWANILKVSSGEAKLHPVGSPVDYR